MGPSGPRTTPLEEEASSSRQRGAPSYDDDDEEEEEDEEAAEEKEDRVRPLLPDTQRRRPFFDASEIEHIVNWQPVTYETSASGVTPETAAEELARFRLRAGGDFSVDYRDGYRSWRLGRASGATESSSGATGCHPVARRVATLERTTEEAQFLDDGGGGGARYLSNGDRGGVLLPPHGVSRSVWIYPRLAPAERDTPRYWWRYTVAYWVSTTFMIGSVLFVTGAAFSYAAEFADGREPNPIRQSATVQWPYFIGGLFFVIGSYLGFFAAINLGLREDLKTRRLVCFHPGRASLRLYFRFKTASASVARLANSCRALSSREATRFVRRSRRHRARVAAATSSSSSAAATLLPLAAATTSTATTTTTSTMANGDATSSQNACSSSNGHVRFGPYDAVGGDDEENDRPQEEAEEEADDDKDGLASEWTDETWREALDVDPEAWHSYFGYLSYLVGACWFQVGIVADMAASHGVLDSFDSRTRNLCSAIPATLGGFLFVVGAWMAVDVNESWRPALAVSDVAWWVSNFNFVGSALFLVAGVFCFDGLAEKVGGTTQTLVNLPYLIGSAQFLLASSLELFMWRVELHGLSFVRAINKSTKLTDLVRTLLVGGDNTDVSSSSSGGNNNSVDVSGISLNQLAFVFTVVLTYAFSIMDLVFAALFAGGRCHDETVLQSAYDIYDSALQSLLCFAALALASVVHTVPKQRPFGMLLWILRVAMVLLLGRYVWKFVDSWDESQANNCAHHPAETDPVPT